MVFIFFLQPDSAWTASNSAFKALSSPLRRPVRTRESRRAEGPARQKAALAGPPRLGGGAGTGRRRRAPARPVPQPVPSRRPRRGGRGVPSLFLGRSRKSVRLEKADRVWSSHRVYSPPAARLSPASCWRARQPKRLQGRERLARVKLEVWPCLCRSVFAEPGDRVVQRTSPCNLGWFK